MAIALALASALTYGVSDYIGGRVSRRFAPVVVALAAELTLTAILVAVVPAVEAEGPPAAALAWGVVAGVAGSLGVLGLYAALSRGNMTVVAPVTGVVAAVVPVVVGLALGERPGVVVVAGIAVALVAVGLIGGMVGVTFQAVDAGTIVLAIGVGTAFGVLFVAFSRTGDSGLWPLLAARAGGTPLLTGAYLLARRRGRAPRFEGRVVGVGIVIGVLVGVSNGLYLASTREGLLSVVAVVVALYPASTIVLASILDHERAGRSQLFGMLLAAVAVAMITAGS